MEFSIQEIAEVLLSVLVFSIVIHAIYANFNELQVQVVSYISTWCSYGI